MLQQQVDHAHLIFIIIVVIDHQTVDSVGQRVKELSRIFHKAVVVGREHVMVSKPQLVMPVNKRRIATEPAWTQDPISRD